MLLQPEPNSALLIVDFLPAVAMLGAWVAGLVHAAPAGQNRSLIFIASNETNPVRTLTGVTWGTPNTLLSPRFARLQMQFDF